MLSYHPGAGSHMTALINIINNIIIYCDVNLIQIEIELVLVKIEL